MVDSPSSPVTVVVRRRIQPEFQDDFESWLEGIISAASAFEGHLGAKVIRPSDPVTQDYVVIFRFASLEQLERWEASDVRAEWAAKAEPFTVGAPELQKVTGLEFWFALPGDAARRPPPRWKMVVVTIIAIYPLILFLVPLLIWLHGGLPTALAALLNATIMVTLMSYAVMPFLTRLFRRWLFPRNQH